MILTKQMEFIALMAASNALSTNNDGTLDPSHEKLKESIMGTPDKVVKVMLAGALVMKDDFSDEDLHTAILTRIDTLATEILGG